MFQIFIPVPVDLTKLSNVVKNDVVKIYIYIYIYIYIHNANIKIIEDKTPDITNLATKTTLNTKVGEVKGKIRNITSIVTNGSLNVTINEIKSEISNITNLATTNEIPSVSNLVFKKTEYNIKINEIEQKITDNDHSNKYITTPKFNKLPSENYGARLKQAD